MYEDSLYEIEETSASVLVKGLIDQGQIEPSCEDQSEEIEDKLSNACEKKLTSKGKSYKTLPYQRKSSRHTTSWIRVLILENLKGKEMPWTHKRNGLMKPTKPTMICWNHLMTQTHPITSLTYVTVSTNSVE